jgi:GxxExxY protein
MLLDDERLNGLTGSILGCAIEVHRVLGPGLLESVYKTCLHHELSSRKLRFISHRRIPVIYKGADIEGAYQLDLMIEDAVIVEIKAVEAILPVHKAQLYTYLRLTKCRTGLLINFNVPKLMDGVRRLLNPFA